MRIKQAARRKLTEWDATSLVRLSPVSSRRIGTRRRKPSHLTLHLFYHPPRDSSPSFRVPQGLEHELKARLLVSFGRGADVAKTETFVSPAPIYQNKSSVRKTSSRSKTYDLLKVVMIRFAVSSPAQVKAI